MSEPDVVTQPERPMRADAMRNYRKLLDAATEVFSESGTEASLEEIARRAGVGVGTLYRHFPRREMLVEVVLNEHLESMRGRIEAERSAPVTAGSIRNQLWLYLEFTRRFGGIVAHQMARSVDRNPSWASCSLTVKSGFQQLFDQAHAQGLIREDVRWTEVMRMLSGIGMSLRANISRLPEEELDETARRMFDITVMGILKHPD